MRAEDWPKPEMPEGPPGFASLSKVSVRRAAAAQGKSGKKSDITDTLASMRAAPEFLNAAVPPVNQEMRDVTPPPPTDFVAFWKSLCLSGGLPSRDDLKVSDFAARWPNLLLFRCSPPDSLRPDSAFAMALRAHGGREKSGGAITRGVEMTAMLSQSILTVAKAAAQNGSPVRGTSRFDTPDGPVSYELSAVPFGSGSVDHVLCNVDRA